VSVRGSNVGRHVAPHLESKLAKEGHTR